MVQETNSKHTAQNRSADYIEVSLHICRVEEETTAAPMCYTAVPETGSKGEWRAVIESLDEISRHQSVGNLEAMPCEEV